MEIVRNNTASTPTRTKFTPGPWKRDTKYSCDILAPDGELLASTYTMQSANGGFEAEAGNAQLMHCATELLEALEQTASAFERCMQVADCGPEFIYSQIAPLKTLIAKAKGEV